MLVTPNSAENTDDPSMSLMAYDHSIKRYLIAIFNRSRNDNDDKFGPLTRTVASLTCVCSADISLHFPASKKEVLIYL